MSSMKKALCWFLSFSASLVLYVSLSISSLCLCVFFRYLCIGEFGIRWVVEGHSGNVRLLVHPVDDAVLDNLRLELLGRGL